ncbi:hypothetical protein [Phycicoccus flavus]|uniref:Uncharacterized protein n=1 Tax=Phycicoccus flavus TaxID=2502783 RepID=A0A8T6R1U1_9MICO|nr:hypothetical protein [Phycicoccus flavus]NHA67460.1 hypothetical protein [Phycicoccus flavus]
MSSAVLGVALLAGVGLLVLTAVALVLVLAVRASTSRTASRPDAAPDPHAPAADVDGGPWP